MTNVAKKTIVSKYEFRTDFSKEVFSSTMSVDLESDTPVVAVLAEKLMLDIQVHLETLITAYDSGALESKDNPSYAIDKFYTLYPKMKQAKTYYAKLKELEYASLKDYAEAYTMNKKLLEEYVGYIKEEQDVEFEANTEQKARFEDAQVKVNVKTRA